jgi:acyl phosphate:glycerol-3-phosphate acyltransferase
MIIIKLLAIIFIGYVLGSIPCGLLILRRGNNVDIRNFGSGKIGATNVLRTAGKKKAAITAALDIFKGVLAVFFAGLIMGDSYILAGNITLGADAAKILAAIASVVGHIWPVFLKFRGGRGVAVFFGTMLSLSPVVALSGGASLLLTAGLTRYVSLGSIIGTIVTYAVLSFLAIRGASPVEYLTYSVVGTLLIIIMHRDNIERLIAGKERKLGEKADRRELPTS